MLTRSSSSRFNFDVVLLAGVLLCSCDPEAPISLAQPLEGNGGLLTTAVQIAAPYRARFPKDTLRDCFARSIWDMHTFEGRIYIGAGDSWNNTGGVPVWSLGDDGVATDVRLETVVADEQVAFFHDYNGRLYIPGIDATESWDLGNFYVKQNGTWQKRRTIPNAVHVWDIAAFQGKLYAFINNKKGKDLLLESADDGNTWQQLSEKTIAGAMTPLDDGLLTMGDCSQGGRGCIGLVGSGKPQSVRVPVPTFWEARSERFANGVLYTDSPFWLTYVSTYRPPLVFVGLPDGPYLEIADFGEDTLAGTRDVLVEGQTAFVLTAARHSTAPGVYVGYIYSSTDLQHWSKLAEFNVPALPYSFARLGGRFYVGLGADGLFASSTAVPLPQSGSIWRLE